jgi:hypothetical protein
MKKRPPIPNMEAHYDQILESMRQPMPRDDREKADWLLDELLDRIPDDHALVVFGPDLDDDDGLVWQVEIRDRYKLGERPHISRHSSSVLNAIEAILSDYDSKP